MAIMSPSLSLKDRISSPLEAGHSIAEGYRLPHRVTSALEYASKRLARKETTVTLLAVQREYQLPASRLPPSAHPSSLASPLWSQLRAEASGHSTPTRHSFASSAFSTLKQLIRSSVTTEPPIRERIVHIVDSNHDHSRRDIISPALSDVSASSASTASTALTSDSLFSNRFHWPTTPAYDSEPATPATPFTVASSMSATETGSIVSALGLQPDEFGARFVYVGALSSRDERVLSMTIEKTARKFSIGPDWLPTPLPPTLLGLSPDVVQRSVAQNEVLFASDSLVVLSLDHLFTFRAALQSYACTQSATRLEDAVDELRRLILASPGRAQLRKSALLGTYRWLEPVSEEALGDVGKMYGRAYGVEGGVEDDTSVDGAAGREAEVATPTFGSMKGGRFGGRDGAVVVETSEDSPRMMMPPSGREKGEEGGFPGWLREDQGDEQGETDAIEEWYRQVRLQPVDIIPNPRSVEGPGSEPVSPLADTAITPRATPVSTPMMARFPARSEKAGVPVGEPVSPVTPRATPASTPMLARFPARDGEGEAGAEVVEARELSTTPKPTPKPAQDLVGAERVASWFLRTTPKPTPSPPQEVKTADHNNAETMEARRLSITPKPTPAPVQGANTVDVHEATTEEPRHLNTTPKPTLLIIPKPIRATIQHTRAATDPPVLRVQTNFDAPSPRGSPQPVSALSLASTSSHGRGTTELDTPLPQLSLLPLTPDSQSEGEGDDLTARPRTEQQQPTWWDGGGMSLSIEEVMRSPVTAVEVGAMGGMGGLFSSNTNNNSNSNANPAALPLTPLPFASPITPLSAIPAHLGGKQPYGPLTPLPGMARFEVNTPRYQQPATPRYNHGGMWQGGGGWLSPQQPMSALWNGPSTPNGYNDISPITRGEWGFLMGGGAGGVGRQAGVGRVDVEGEPVGVDGHR
ncbi:hypothetical protein B0T18DRAFT_433203 [Schizothecium vesticola]|uniref:DUF7582 domain-containing protein n=1 Tax=Schizothecium vesticola TaxID=314040 RepID=A0AA40BQH6_9PEZI|nr:hypothetical protein B0T18DRAFT_433203 [Schizothecium vesticola]